MKKHFPVVSPASSLLSTPDRYTSYIHNSDGPDGIFLISADADVYADTGILTYAGADVDI